MASVSMAAATFLGGAATFGPSSVSQRNSHKRLVITNSVKKANNIGKVSCENKQEEEGNNGNGRREMLFVAASTALWSIAGMAVADEPKRGTPAAKKAYSPVCVANPTARICNY